MLGSGPQACSGRHAHRRDRALRQLAFQPVQADPKANVRFGLQTDQEMMYGFFFHTVIARKEAPSERKREHIRSED
jgi:hypothetical protein